MTTTLQRFAASLVGFWAFLVLEPASPGGDILVVLNP
jgi:hypothetical protein